MSVSFTDEEEKKMQERGYQVLRSEMGNVYCPKEGIRLLESVAVNYVEYPWITCFETEGIEII